MRSLALAAAILLVLRPETVTEPGFQMSFAAVAALVAVAEWESRRRIRRGALWRHVRAIAMTSLIASLATLPYAIFHFGRATHYAVLGNLLAMPVMGLWVMPSAALSVAAMPLGWEAGPLHLLGWGIGVMLALGRFVSGLPGAVSALPAMPMATLVLVSLGGLWCALWRGAMRWLGVIGIAAGVVVMLGTRPPDVLIAADGLTVALRGPAGLAFVGAPADAYIARAWLAGAGQEEDVPFVPAPARCDGMGCVARLADGRLLAVGRRAEAAPEDCARAALVISAADTFSCPGALLAAGRAQLAQAQGYAVTGSRVESVRAWRGTRPWVQ
jgi:competence protein ComEC